MFIKEDDIKLKEFVEFKARLIINSFPDAEKAMQLRDYILQLQTMLKAAPNLVEFERLQRVEERLKERIKFYENNLAFEYLSKEFKKISTGDV